MQGCSSETTVLQYAELLPRSLGRFFVLNTGLWSLRNSFHQFFFNGEPKNFKFKDMYFQIMSSVWGGLGWVGGAGTCVCRRLQRPEVLDLPGATVGDCWWSPWMLGNKLQSSARAVHSRPLSRLTNPQSHERFTRLPHAHLLTFSGPREAPLTVIGRLRPSVAAFPTASCSPARLRMRSRQGFSGLAVSLLRPIKC